MESKQLTYSKCSVLLSLLSLIKVTALAGFCGGLSWGVLRCFLDFMQIKEFSIFNNYMVTIIGFPVLGFAIGIASAVFGYPLYKWICINNEGQDLIGVFHNPRSRSSFSEEPREEKLNNM
jgi:hypothetical protein